MSPYTYPSEFIDKFKQELEAITEDYNGDGKVSVEIETFQIILSTMNQDQEIDPQLVMAEQTRISVVHQTASPVIFIMEPSCAKFYQETFALAGNWDGTFADEDTPLSELAMRWSDVEGLANLNLDFTITDYTMEDIEITTMQDVMAEHYVSVMPLWEKQLNKEKTYKQWAASRDSLAKWAGIVIE